MKILFTDHIETLAEADTVRKRCAEKVEYKYQVELINPQAGTQNKNSSNVLMCTHIKSL